VCDHARSRVSGAVLRSHLLRGRMEGRVDGAKARAAAEASAVVGSVHETGGPVGRPHGPTLGWPAGTQASVDRHATNHRFRTRLAFVRPRSCDGGVAIAWGSVQGGVGLKRCLASHPSASNSRSPNSRASDVLKPSGSAPPHAPRILSES